jgi:hypothetical protein
MILNLMRKRRIEAGCCQRAIALLRHKLRVFRVVGEENLRSAVGGTKNDLELGAGAGPSSNEPPSLRLYKSSREREAEPTGNRLNCRRFF